MVNAIITNGDQRGVISFPCSRMRLAGELAYLGISTPPREIPCSDDEDNEIQVKIFGETEDENRMGLHRMFSYGAFDVGPDQFDIVIATHTVRSISCSFAFQHQFICSVKSFSKYQFVCLALKQNSRALRARLFCLTHV